MCVEDSGTINVCIAICTFGRPERLKALLEGICTQQFMKVEKPHISIIVVDNGPDDETRAVYEAIRKSHPDRDIRYIVEPVRGISFARNTALDNVPAHCDYLAMIDDDEIPSLNWLDELLFSQAKHGENIIRGPVIPIYEKGVPKWVKERHYFGWPSRRLKDGVRLKKGATNNILLNWKVLKSLQLRFDERLARTGGEDTVFFNKLICRHGFEICYAENARVYEGITRERASLYSLLRFHYRLGANRLLKKRLDCCNTGRKTLSLVPLHMWHGMRHIAAGMTGMLFMPVPSLWRNGYIYDSLFKVARGVGHFAGLFGFHYHFYGKRKPR